MVIEKIEPWLDQVAPMSWRNGRIYYHKTGTGVVAESYSSLPDGSDERLETGSVKYPLSTHQGISDVSPDGKFALTTVERSNHWPYPDGDKIAAPGAGTYNDLWLLDLESGETWKLVDLRLTKNAALIWPRFDTTGIQITWTQLWQPRWYDLGGWVLKVADLVINNNVPSLKNVRSFKSNGFIEAYEFLDGNSSVLATASLPGISSLNPQIVKYPITNTEIKPPVRLSPKSSDDVWGLFGNYCEFAYSMPAFPGYIMFGRTRGAKNGSIEFWTMQENGLDVTRLTYMSEPGHAHYQGNPQVILGGIGWDEDDPHRFVVGYALDYDNNYKSAMITLAE